MDQFLSRTSTQIGNKSVDMYAVPLTDQESQGTARFTFIVRATPESPSECRIFRLDQASLLEEHHRFVTFARMVSCIWGRADDPVSFLTFQYHLSVFCHETIRERNGLGVGFYIHIISHNAGTLQQQQSVNTNIGEEMIDEGLVFTASERGLHQMAIAKLERVDAAVVLNHDDRCSICFEELKEITDDLNSGLARAPCSHMFHSGCIALWLKRSSTCPLCRREIR